MATRKLLSILLLNPLTAIGSKYPPATVDMKWQQVSDHVYYVPGASDIAADIIAPGGFRDYLDSPAAADRLEERRISLYPWVNENTRLVRPDRVITEDTVLPMDDVTRKIGYLGAAHSDGDIIFEGRVPYRSIGRRQ